MSLLLSPSTLISLVVSVSFVAIAMLTWLAGTAIWDLLLIGAHVAEIFMS